MPARAAAAAAAASEVAGSSAEEWISCIEGLMALVVFCLNSDVASAAAAAVAAAITSAAAFLFQAISSKIGVKEPHLQVFCS
ncbi:MAG: hypothetical protein WDW38_005880 [Sanguina aurantia]